MDLTGFQTEAFLGPLGRYEVQRSWAVLPDQAFLGQKNFQSTYTLFVCKTVGVQTFQGLNRSNKRWLTMVPTLFKWRHTHFA